MIPRRAVVAGVLWWSAAATGLSAQYYNSDAGHPFRVEDALVLPTRALSLDVANVRIEQLTGRGIRYRFEPAAEWGVSGQTEIGVRFPLVIIPAPSGSGVRTTRGLAGIALGGLRALNLETPRVPGIALAGEVQLPVGALSAKTGSFVAKAIFSKRFSAFRLHMNGGGGTYAVRASPDAVCSDSAQSSGSCSDVPIIIDLPCSRSPAPAPALSAVPANGSEFAPRSLCMGQTNSATALVVPAPRLNGGRWFSGIGADHAFALASTSIGAEYIVEKFVGLYPITDHTAAIGFRSQTSPSSTLNGSFAWHFAGTVRSFTFNAGVTMEFSWPFLHRASRD